MQRTAINREAYKNSKGEIRTLDLTGMSRALSPTELPCHLKLSYSIVWLSCFELLLSLFNWCSLCSRELPCHLKLSYSIVWLGCFEYDTHKNQAIYHLIITQPYPNFKYYFIFLLIYPFTPLLLSKLS